MRMHSWFSFAAAIAAGVFSLALVVPQSASAQNCLYCPGYSVNYRGAGGGGQNGTNEAYSATEGAERTVEMWFQAKDASGSTPQVLFDSGDDVRGFNVYLYDGTLYAGAWADSTGNFNNHWLSTSAVENGTWHHVAYVFDANSDNAYLYLDGEKMSSGSPGAPLPAHGAANGFAQVNDTTAYHDEALQPDTTAPAKYHYFTGLVDNVRIWRGVLSQSEIRSRKNRQLWNAKYDETAYPDTVNTPFAGGTLSDTLEIHWPYNASSGESSPGWGYVGLSNRGVADEGDVRYAPAPEGDFVDTTDAPITTAQIIGEGLTGTDSTANGPAGSSVSVSVGGGDTTLVSYFGTPGGSPVGVESGAAKARLNVGWSITPQGASSGGSIELDVTFDYSNLGDTPSEVKLLKRDGANGQWTDVTSDWTQDGSTFTNSSLSVSVGNTVEYAIGGDEAPLPVELTRFEGARTDAGVELTWRTASERNNAGFQVQRKTDQGDWTKVGFLDPKNGGSTTEAQTYRFVDTDLPFADGELTYRLRQVDLDGSASYSELVTVERGPVRQLRLMGTYPNPVQSQATVKFALPKKSDAGEATLNLYDALGRKVRSVDVAVRPGRHKQQLDVSGLSSGVYFLRLTAGNDTKTRRLTIVR